VESAERCDCRHRACRIDAINLSRFATGPEISFAVEGQAFGVIESARKNLELELPAGLHAACIGTVVAVGHGQLTISLAYPKRVGLPAIFGYAYMLEKNSGWRIETEVFCLQQVVMIFACFSLCILCTNMHVRESSQWSQRQPVCEYLMLLSVTI